MSGTRLPRIEDIYRNACFVRLVSGPRRERKCIAFPGNGEEMVLDLIDVPDADRLAPPSTQTVRFAKRRDPSIPPRIAAVSVVLDGGIR